MIEYRTLDSGRRVLPEEMGAPRVWNKRNEDFPRDGAYVGRPSRWGNPFRIGRDGTRAEVIARYTLWLNSKPELVADAKAVLQGRDLICWCSPDACHADVLFAIANEPAATDSETA